MATAYLCLGQSAPAATTATTLYTVPSATSAVVSAINVCNTGGVADTIRIAIRPAGASLTTSQYFAYNVPIASGAFLTINAGITMATTDVITVYSTNGTSSFSAFGSQVS